MTCLLPLIQWTVLEDPSFEGLDVAQATRKFDDWRADISVERDGEGSDHVAVRTGAVVRFQYFVIVDDEALGSVGEEGKGMKVRVVDAGKPPECEIFRGLLSPEEVARDRERQEQVEREGAERRVEREARRQAAGGGAVEEDEDDYESESDDDDDDDDDDDEEDLQSQHDPIEGRTSWDVGWMWVDVQFLLSFYDILMADSGWDHFYVRPPKVYGRYTF